MAKLEFIFDDETNQCQCIVSKDLKKEFGDATKIILHRNKETNQYDVELTSVFYSVEDERIVKKVYIPSSIEEEHTEMTIEETKKE